MKKYLFDIMLALLASGITGLFYDIPLIAVFSLFYSIILIIRLLDAVGKRLPFKELIVSIMGVQLLLAPYLEYYFFQFKVFGGMNIDSDLYFSYALPSTLLLQLGLELFYPTKNFETKLFEVLPKKKSINEVRGFYLILVGYGAYFFSEWTSIGGSLEFFLYLIAFCRFIGFLYLWFSGSRYTIWAFLFVVIPFIIEAINEALFIQVIVYATILMSIYYMKHKTSKIKIYTVFAVSAFILILTQSVKSSYRAIVSDRNFEGNSSLVFAQTVFDQLKNLGTLDMKKLAGLVNVRMNQGWIVADIMDNLGENAEKREPKYFKRELIGIFLPRALYPEKPIVGDHKKFREFVGWKLNKRVAMSVGIMGDGYGNFGYLGGMVYCFSFGVFLGLVFKVWNKLSLKYPTLFIWGVLIFFYCMRAGDEAYIIVNWIVKSSMFVFLYFLLFEANNKINKYYPIPGMLAYK